MTDTDQQQNDMTAYGIVANVISDRVLRTGAKVWIVRCNGDATNPIVVGRSKSGRVVEKYTAYKRLTNYRAAWIPEHLRTRVCLQWGTKAEAAACADGYARMWAGVRSYSRDGKTLRQDGISENEAFARLRTTGSTQPMAKIIFALALLAVPFVAHGQECWTSCTLPASGSVCAPMQCSGAAAGVEAGGVGAMAPSYTLIVVTYGADVKHSRGYATLRVCEQSKSLAVTGKSLEQVEADAAKRRKAYEEKQAKLRVAHPPRQPTADERRQWAKDGSVDSGGIISTIEADGLLHPQHDWSVSTTSVIIGREIHPHDIKHAECVIEAGAR